MSEYIITDEGMGFDLEDALAQGGFIKRRIVCCRDCKHHENHGYWFMCQLPDCDGGYANWMVEPDGFCKWGERRDA